MKAFKYIHIIIFLLLVKLGFAGFDASADVVPGNDGRIEGSVYDPGTKAPVEFANVVVYDPQDSAMITGGLSDADGNFHLKDIPVGNYYMTVHFIGYNKKVISNLEITPKQKHIDLGTIELLLTAVELTAATITADKMAVEYKLDRKVINVDQDLDAAGNSAVEILEKAPSIRVDISGDVYLRGSSNFTVLIDGKPSVLTGSEALQQIPASTIENIEIITNPSVKYDPDGTAGIININTKKNKLDGLAGVINATAGTGDKYATDLSLNYKTGKFNILGGVEWNDRQFPWTQTQQRQTNSGDTTRFKDSFGDGGWMRDGFKLRGSVDFNQDEKTSYSLGGEYGTFGFGMDNYMHIHEYSEPGSGNRYYINDDKRRWTRDYYSLNGSFRKAFDRKGQNLTLYGQYNNRDGSEVQDKTEFDTDADWNSIDQFPLLLRAVEAGPSQQVRFESDYTHPLGASGKMETGYHFRWGKEDETARTETWDYDRGEWLEDEYYYKESKYRRSIHAVYGIYSNSWKTLEYQLGLRGEYTYREVTVVNTDETSLVDRFDYFPSLHLSNRFNDKNQVMASYSRRIERPRGYYLEPYETYLDEDTRRIGNPALLPEYTDSYEMGYLRTLEKGNVSADVYYRKTDNKITTIQTVDPSTGILYYTYENINLDKAMGVEGAFMYDFTKWFNLNLSGTFYNYVLEDKTSIENGTKSSNNWDVRAITSFKLPTQTRVQLNLSYDSPTVAAQGNREENYYMDFTIRQDLLKKQLNITFKVDDVFATRREVTETFGENFYVFNEQRRESRIMTLTLSYRLNNFKERQERRGEGGGDL